MSPTLKLMDVISICTIEHCKLNKQSMIAPTILGLINFTRSTAPQQKRYIRTKCRKRTRNVS